MKDRNPTTWISRSMSHHRVAPQPYRPSPEFFALADPIIATKHTLLSHDRLYVLWQAVRNVARVPGAVVEVGVYRGGSAYFLASALQQVAQAVPIFLVDTFTGHPAISDRDPHQEVGRFRKTSVAAVREYLAPFPNVAVLQGDVADILPTLAEMRYRLIHLDTDLFTPTRVSLEYFGARVERGGIVVLDDYSSGRCPGVMQAVQEYLATDAVRFHVWDQRTEQLILVKR